MRGMMTTVDEFARIIIGADSIIYSSIYTTNPAVVVFHEKTSKYSVFRVDAPVGKVHVVDLDADDFSFNVANIAPGSQLDQIVVMAEDGRLFVARLKMGERATIETIIEEFSIGSSVPVSQGAFKHSEVFIPVFIEKKLRGVLLASKIETMEEFWFYLTHGKTLFEYPFDAVAFNFYINDARKGVSVLYVDYESIVLIQYDPQKVVSQSDTVFNIDFGVECHDEIVDMLFKHKYGLMLSINNRVITLWSPEAKYEYAADLLRFYTKIKDQPYDECYPTVNCRYAFVRKNGKLHHVNFSFGRIHESPLNSFLEGTDKQPIFEIQSDAVIYHLVHQKMFLVEEDFKYRLCLDNDEQKLLTYSIHQGNLRGGDFFENLDNPDVCPPELRNKLLSALNLANVTVLDSRIEQMKEQQRVISEKKQHRFFTKEQDLELLNELFSSKNYTDFAIKYQRTTMAIFFHVKTRFKLPRCNDHRAFTKECDKCQESLRKWRADGLKIIEGASYRTSTTMTKIEPVTMESISSARQLGYYKRRMKESTYALCEMNKQLGLPEEIISGALKILAEYTAMSTWVGRSEEQILVAALYIELKRIGNEMRAKDLLLQAERMTTCSRERFKSNIMRVVQEIQRALGIRFIPQSFEAAFLKSRLARDFSPVELSAICAYLRALDARPRLTSGKSRTAFMGAAIYSACKRIGARAWIQSRCSEVVGATEVTIRNRVADIQPFEDEISDDELKIPVQRPELAAGCVPTDDDEKSSTTNEDISADAKKSNNTRPQLTFTFDERIAAFEKLSRASDAILGFKKPRLLEESRKVLEKNVQTLKNDKRYFDAEKPAERVVIDMIDERIAMIEKIITERGDEGINQYYARHLPTILKAHRVEIERIISHVNRAYTSVDAAREIVTKFFSAPSFIKNELISLVSSNIRGQTLLTSQARGDEGKKAVGEQNKASLGVVDSAGTRKTDIAKRSVPSLEHFSGKPSEMLDEPPEVAHLGALENGPPINKSTAPVDAHTPPTPKQHQESTAMLPTDSVESILKRKKSDFVGTSRIELVRILSTLDAEKKKFNSKNPDDMLVLIRIAESIAIIKQVIAGQNLGAEEEPTGERTGKPTTGAEKVKVTGEGKAEKRSLVTKAEQDVASGEGTLEGVEATSSLLGIARLASKSGEAPSTPDKDGKPINNIDLADKYMKSEFTRVVQRNNDELARIVGHVNQYYTAKDAARDIVRKFCKVSPDIKDYVIILITERIRNKDASIDNPLRQKNIPLANRANPMPAGLDYGKLIDPAQKPPEKDGVSNARLKVPALRIVQMSKQGLQKLKSIDLERYIDILKREKMRFNPRSHEDKEIRDTLDRTITLINQVKRESFDRLGQRFLEEELPKVILNNMIKIKDIISHVNPYYTVYDAAREIAQKYINGSPVLKEKATEVIADRIRKKTLFVL